MLVFLRGGVQEGIYSTVLLKLSLKAYQIINGLLISPQLFPLAKVQLHLWFILLCLPTKANQQIRSCKLFSSEISLLVTQLLFSYFRTTGFSISSTRPLSSIQTEITLCHHSSLFGISRSRNISWHDNQQTLRLKPHGLKTRVSIWRVHGKRSPSKVHVGCQLRVVECSRVLYVTRILVLWLTKHRRVLIRWKI